MKFLLDTNILIWFMNGDKNISASAVNKIKNDKNTCIVSIASIWQIAIKSNLGKLEIKVDFNDIAGFLYNNDLKILPIEFHHLTTLLNLELIHRDPFDRIIISQAITENLPIITADKIFKDYPVKCLS